MERGHMAAFVTDFTCYEKLINSGCNFKNLTVFTIKGITQMNVPPVHDRLDIVNEGPRSFIIFLCFFSSHHSCNIALSTLFTLFNKPNRYRFLDNRGFTNMQICNITKLCIILKNYMP